MRLNTLFSYQSARTQSKHIHSKTELANKKPCHLLTLLVAFAYLKQKHHLTRLKLLLLFAQHPFTNHGTRYVDLHPASSTSTVKIANAALL